MDIPILMYHAVLDARTPLATPIRVFESQMAWLHKRGYQAITFGSLVRGLEQHRQFPAHTVCLTFDDGFQSIYDHAFPILRDYGFAATVFLVSAFCGKVNRWPGQPASIPTMPLMDWDQIRALDRQGIEIGSHSMTHPRLDQLPPPTLEEEIAGSKELIESRLGHPIDVFAYPYGFHNQTVRALVKKHYRGACTTKLGLVSPTDSLEALKRVDINVLTFPYQFHLLASQAFPLYLWLRRILRGLLARVFKRAWA